MKYQIDQTSKEPAYLQLYKQLRSDIAHEIYPVKSRLPSKRTLAAELDLSLVTVEHAYALLCDEGYAQARERSGYFVSFRAEDGFLSGAGIAPQPSLPLQTPEPQDNADFPFSVLAKTMRSVLSAFGPQILQPSDNKGHPLLREALRSYLARSRGIEADTSQIVVGAGTEYLYRLLVELFGREKLYAIEEPSYQRIEQVYRASDVRLEHLPLGHDGIETAALRASQADILHISPYRSFPSGVTASASKRAAYLQWASRGERYIVEDDYESEFSISKKAEETLFAHTHQNRVVYLNTFSGTVSPALRMGYMVLPPQLVEPFQTRVGFYSCTVPTYLQLVVATLLTNGDFERHINRVRRQKRKQIGKG